MKFPDLWYGPLVIWPGIILGFVVNRYAREREACLVWAPALLWLVIGISKTAPPQYIHTSRAEYVRTQLFPARQGECDNECLGLPIYTWPAVSASGYSLAALAALLTAPRKTDE
jgi:hypothetical protein